MRIAMNTMYHHGVLNQKYWKQDICEYQWDWHRIALGHFHRCWLNADHIDEHECFECGTTVLIEPPEYIDGILNLK